MFGATSSPYGQQPSPGFGTTGGIFGQASTPAMSGSLFGNIQQSPGMNLFGQQTQQPQQQQMMVPAQPLGEFSLSASSPL